MLKDGCHVIYFRPRDSSGLYVGTLRVKDTKTPSRPWVSGDLYRFEGEKELSQFDGRLQIVDGRLKFPKTKDGQIPVFPLANYSHYLEVTPSQSLEGQTTLSVQFHRLDGTRKKLITGATFRLALKPDGDRPDWYSAEASHLGKVRGEFQFGWISPALRRAHLRIVRVRADGKDAVKVPGHLAQARQKWGAVFKSVDWQLDVSDDHELDLPLRVPEGWSPFDLGFMAKHANDQYSKSCAHDWVYSLFCVSRFENSRFLGIMFDSEATDLNSRPRECAAVAALEEMEINGKKVAAQDAFGGKLYFRTAIHEVGHMMNLTHTYDDSGFMNTTDQLLTRADGAGAAVDFKPDWWFGPEDRDWLRHAPDIAIRPGGISRSDVQAQCDWKSGVNLVSLRNESAITLNLAPVLPKFPFGAPVRIDYDVTSRDSVLRVPVDISLRGGFVSGRVTGSDRKTRYFRTAFRCCDSVKAIKPELLLNPLPPGKSRESGITLLQGTDGPLFPKPGAYRVELEMRWDINGQTLRAIGTTSVSVEEPAAKDVWQQRAAEVALNSSSMMVALVQGIMDSEGKAALSLALKSETLAPHYRALAIKCWDKQKRLANQGLAVKPGELPKIRPLKGLKVAAAFFSRIGRPASDSVMPLIVATKREIEQLEPMARMENEIRSWIEDLKNSPASVSGPGKEDDHEHAHAG